jgi:hypothetical protein
MADSKVPGWCCRLCLSTAFSVVSIVSFCIVSVLEVERIRAVGRTPLSISTERWTGRGFQIAFVGTLAAAITLSWRGSR